jgi:hypothetical protein
MDQESIAMTDYVKFVERTLNEMVTQSVSEALQRQLANDEPKCGNCSYWDQTNREKLVTHGACRRLYDVYSQELQEPFAVAMSLTLDLSVCSKWERKAPEIIDK